MKLLENAWLWTFSGQFRQVWTGTRCRFLKKTVRITKTSNTRISSTWIDFLPFWHLQLPDGFYILRSIFLQYISHENVHYKTHQSARTGRIAGRILHVRGLGQSTRAISSWMTLNLSLRKRHSPTLKKNSQEMIGSVIGFFVHFWAISTKFSNSMDAAGHYNH